MTITNWSYSSAKLSEAKLLYPLILPSIMNKSLLLVVMIASIAFSGCIETSQSTENGFITAMACEGIIFNTCNISFKSDTESSSTRSFCVDDEAEGFETLKSQIQEHMENRDRVNLNVHREMFVWYDRCGDGSSGIVDSVSLIE